MQVIIAIIWGEILLKKGWTKEYTSYNNNPAEETYFMQLITFRRIFTKLLITSISCSEWVLQFQITDKSNS